jgi:putative copper export protein
MNPFDSAFYFLHLVAAMFWIGGIAYILFVLMPAVPKIALRDRSQFMPIVLRRFLIIVWTAIGTLVATGIYRLGRFWDLTQPGFFSTPAGEVLLVKMLLVAGLVLIASHVTWRSVPNAVEHVSTHVGDPPDAYKCPQCGAIVGNLRTMLQRALGLALAIVFAAIHLRGV